MSVSYTHLGAGQRDLLRDLGGGHQALGQADAVVLEVDAVSYTHLTAIAVLSPLMKAFGW